MAFKAIVLPSFEGQGELPWLSDYITQVPSCLGTTFQVKLVSFSPKGVMVTTDYWKGFLFRSHPYYDFLFEAVTAWSEVNEPVCALVAMVDVSQKSKFQLGIEDTLESYWIKKTETLFTLKLGSLGIQPTPHATNPLLAVSSTSALNKSGRNGKGRSTGKGGQDKAGKAARSLAKAANGSVVIDEPFDEAWGVPDGSSLESED